MAGFSVDHFPALLKMYGLDCEARETALRQRSEEIMPLIALYAYRDHNRMLGRLSAINVQGSNLVRNSKIVLPVEMWPFASNYAGASSGLGQALGRPISAESIQTSLDEVFDVGGRNFGTMTLSAIRQCTTFAVSAEIADAVRFARRSGRRCDGCVHLTFTTSMKWALRGL
jgi:hypothetical protein